MTNRKEHISRSPREMNRNEVIFDKIKKVLKSFTEEQLLASYDTFKQCHNSQYPEFKRYKDYLKHNIKNVQINLNLLRGGSSPDRYDCKVEGFNHYGGEILDKNRQTFNYRLSLVVDLSLKLVLSTYTQRALYFKKSKIVVLDVIERIKYPSGIVVDEVLVLRHCSHAYLNNRNPPTAEKLFIAFFIDPDNQSKNSSILYPSGLMISSSKKEAIIKCKKELKEAIIDKFNIPD